MSRTVISAIIKNGFLELYIQCGAIKLKIRYITRISRALSHVAFSVTRNATPIDASIKMEKRISEDEFSTHVADGDSKC